MNVVLPLQRAGWRARQTAINAPSVTLEAPVNIPSSAEEEGLGFRPWRSGTMAASGGRPRGGS